MPPLLSIPTVIPEVCSEHLASKCWSFQDTQKAGPQRFTDDLQAHNAGENLNSSRTWLHLSLNTYLNLEHPPHLLYSDKVNYWQLLKSWMACSLQFSLLENSFLQENGTCNSKTHRDPSSWGKKSPDHEKPTQPVWALPALSPCLLRILQRLLMAHSIKSPDSVRGPVRNAEHTREVSFGV